MWTGNVPNDDVLIHQLPDLIRRNLCLSLNDDWRIVADFIKNFISINIEKIEQHSHPPELLLIELGSKLCNVKLMRDILKQKELYNALAVLSVPEQLEIIQHPGGGQDFMLVYLDGCLELTCKAWSLPPPLYQWYHDNKILEGKTSQKLTINNFSPREIGDYHCGVKVDSPGSEEVYSNSVEVGILPEGPSELEQPPAAITVFDGDTLQLRFKVNKAYPPPEYQWMRDNEVLNFKSDTLVIERVNFHDAGVYKCCILNHSDFESNKVSVKIAPGPDATKSWKRQTAKAKIALLIANAEYKNLSCLEKAVNDVELLSEKLTSIGFKVVTLINLTLVEMRNILHKFYEQLVPGVYGLFYFVGHGATAGVNATYKLMLPVDAPNSFNFDHCVTGEEVKWKMLTKNPRLRVIILDMCLKTCDGPNTSLENPLYPTDKPDLNVIYASSTSCNLSAYELRSQHNGPYMKHLSKYIVQDLLVNDMIFKAHLDTYNETFNLPEAKKQVPDTQTNVFDPMSLTDETVSTGHGDVKEWPGVSTKLPKPQFLIFKPQLFEGMTNNPLVTLSWHRGCVLNAMDIELHGISPWHVGISTQEQILKLIKNVKVIKNTNGTNEFLYTITNLQKVKTNISLIISLQDDSKNLTASAHLDVEVPLRKLSLWFQVDEQSND